MVFSSAALPLIGFASIAVDGSADVAMADGEGEGVGRPAAAAAALLPLPLEMSANVFFVAEEGACFIVGIALF